MKYAKWDTKEISLFPNIKSLSQKWVKCVHSLENEYHLILTLGLFSSNLSRRGRVLWNAPITDFMMPLSTMNFVFNVLLWSLVLFLCFDFSDHWALMSNWDLSFFLYILGVWIFLTLPHFPLLLIRDIFGILPLDIFNAFVLEFCFVSWTSKTIFELSLLGIPVSGTVESPDIFGDLIGVFWLSVILWEGVNFILWTPGDWIFWTLPLFLILLNLYLGVMVFLGIGFGFEFSCVSWVFKSTVTMSFFGASDSITFSGIGFCFGSSLCLEFSSLQLSCHSLGLHFQ